MNGNSYRNRWSTVIVKAIHVLKLKARPTFKECASLVGLINIIGFLKKFKFGPWESNIQEANMSVKASR